MRRRAGVAVVLLSLALFGLAACEQQEDPKKALIRAVRSNDRATVDRLLAQGVSPATKDSDNPDARTALFHAATFGYDDLVKLLLSKGADVNGAPGVDVPTPLMIAAFNGRTSTVGLLIEAGADVARRDSVSGTTALAEAASEGHTETVGALLDAGADPNIPLTDGRTPVCMARKSEHAATVQRLLDAGASDAACPQK